MSHYRKFESFVRTIPVVNDAAERNVRLIQDYVNSSYDEELRQDLLLVVEKYRKDVGRPKKVMKNMI